MDKEIILITFDGFQGAGKTTQMRLLKDYIKTSVRIVDETTPSFYEYTEEFVRYFADKLPHYLPRVFNKLIWVNARLHHTKKANVFLMDWVYPVRYAIEEYAEFHATFTNLMLVKPTVSFWLNVPASERRERLIKRKGVVPKKISTLKVNPEPMVILDGTRSIEDLNQEIRNTLESKGCQWIFGN